MNKLLLLSLPAAALLLVGCSEPRNEWVREGANAEELRYARQSCERDAQGYDFIEERGYDDVARERPRTSARSDIYRRCMEGQGWRRQRTEQK